MVISSRCKSQGQHKARRLRLLLPALPGIKTPEVGISVSIVHQPDAAAALLACSSHGLIQQRKEGTDEVIEFEVSGDKIQSVIMLPGYTHNIINLSKTQDLVTVMYCNEVFNPERPDTFFDPAVSE